MNQKELNLYLILQLVAAMKEADFTVYRLAAKTGMKESQLREIIKGESEPKISTLMRLYDAMDYDIVINIQSKNP